MNNPNNLEAMLKNAIRDLLAFEKSPIIQAINGSPNQSKNRSKKPATGQFHLEGKIEHGMTAPYSINGKDFFVSRDTWTLGEVEIGALATVRGLVKHAGERHATKIIVHQQSGTVN